MPHEFKSIFEDRVKAFVSHNREGGYISIETLGDSVHLAINPGDQRADIYFDGVFYVGTNEDIKIQAPRTMAALETLAVAMALDNDAARVARPVNPSSAVLALQNAAGRMLADYQAQQKQPDKPPTAKLGRRRVTVEQQEWLILRGMERLRSRVRVYAIGEDVFYATLLRLHRAGWIVADLDMCTWTVTEAGAAELFQRQAERANRMSKPASGKERG